MVLYLVSCSQSYPSSSVLAVYGAVLVCAHRLCILMPAAFRKLGYAYMLMDITKSSDSYATVTSTALHPTWSRNVVPLSACPVLYHNQNNCVALSDGDAIHEMKQSWVEYVWWCWPFILQNTFRWVSKTGPKAWMLSTPNVRIVCYAWKVRGYRHTSNPWNCSSAREVYP